MTVAICCEGINCIQPDKVSECPGPSSIHYAPLVGAIAMQNPFAIAQDSSRLYVCSRNFGGPIYRILKSTLVIQQTVNLAANEGSAFDIACDANYVFVICRNSADDSGRVLRYDKLTFANKQTINLAQGGPVSVLVDSANPNLLYAMTSDQAGPASPSPGSRLHRIDIPSWTVIDSFAVWNPGVTTSPYTGVMSVGLATPGRLCQNSTYLFFGDNSDYGGVTGAVATRVLKSNPATFTVLPFDPVGVPSGPFGYSCCDENFVWFMKQTAAPQGITRLALSDFFTYVNIASLGIANELTRPLARELTSTSVLPSLTIPPLGTGNARKADVSQDMATIVLTPFDTSLGVVREARGVCYDSATDNRYDLGIYNVLSNGAVYRT